MSKFIFFLFQLIFIHNVGSYDMTAAFDAELFGFEASDLPRNRTEQRDGFDAELFQHLSRNVVLPEIRIEAEMLVGADSVVSLLDQLVGLQFVDQPDSAAFLSHVEDDTILTAHDIHCALKLISA